MNCDLCWDHNVLVVALLSIGSCMIARLSCSWLSALLV